MIEGSTYPPGPSIAEDPLRALCLPTSARVSVAPLASIRTFIWFGVQTTFMQKTTLEVVPGMQVRGARGLGQRKENAIKLHLQN